MKKLKRDEFSALHTDFLASLAKFDEQGVGHESATRSAFQTMLYILSRSNKWLLIPELSKKGKSRIVPDGTIRDENSLPRGYWEAKDTKDNLKLEIKKKIAKGYPTNNIIFEDTKSAVLYQHDLLALEVSMSDEDALRDLLILFFDYTEPLFEDFGVAVEEFSARVPDLAKGLAQKIKEAHLSNKAFKAAYAEFFVVCQQSIDPAISEDLVDELLVQHLLTERLIRNIFQKPEFGSQNIVAQEIEKVINALTSKSFSRTAFLKGLDRF